MTFRPIIVTLSLIAIAAIAAARVPAERAAAGTPRAVTSRPTGPTGVVLPAADPMAVELQREIERSQRDYAALFQRLSLARAESEAFEIQEDMRQQRTELQISLLRIQAAYARRAGRNAFAAQLERAIEALIAPDSPRSGPDERHKS